MQPMIFLFCFFTVCAFGVTCMVKSCDDFMKQTAFDFSCGSKSTCEDEIARQFRVIVPVDSANLFALLSSHFLDELIKPFCLKYNKTEGCADYALENLTVRTQLDIWARSPVTSSLSAIKEQQEAKARQTNLRRKTCRRPESPEYDERCIYLLPFAEFDIVVADRRLLYAHRRERLQLGLISASCTLEGIDKPCIQVIQSRILMQDELVVNATKIVMDGLKKMLGSGFYDQYSEECVEVLCVCVGAAVGSCCCCCEFAAFFLTVVLKVELPCFQELLAPILMLDKDAGVDAFHSAIEAAQNRMVLKEELRRTRIESAIRVFKEPIDPSYFIKRCNASCDNKRLLSSYSLTSMVSHVSIVAEVRGAEFALLKANVVDRLYNLEASLWATGDELKLLKNEAQSCWQDCLGLYNGVIGLEFYVGSTNNYRFSRFPTLLDGICPSSNCVVASLRATRFAVVKNYLFGGFFDSPDKIYWFLGVLTNAVFAVACVILMAFGICVWKIHEFVVFYVVFILLVLISAVLQMVWW
jgi:hypothetical protein